MMLTIFVMQILMLNILITVQNLRNHNQENVSIQRLSCYHM
jgi:hypothetical protein